MRLTHRRARREHSVVSLDHLVGAGQERLRNREAECLCGLQIDYQLQLRGLLNRKIGGLLAVENSANVDAGQPVRIRKACSVAHQAAVNSELAGKVDCWQSVAERQRGELFAPADEEWVGDNKERAG